MNSIPVFGLNAPGRIFSDQNQHGERDLSGDIHSANSSFSQASKYERITAASSLQKDISLKTAEGDTVTISYQKDTAFLNETYDALYLKNSLMQSDRGTLLQQQQAQVHSELLAYSQEEQFSLTISGDLNEGEQRDIREALERIDKLMLETMAGGDLFAGAEDVAGIVGLENIAAVAADYRYQSLITIEEVSQATSTTKYIGEGTLNDRLSDFFNSIATPSATPADRLGELVDEMAQILREQISEKKLLPEQFILPVEQLFADHDERFARAEPDSDQPRAIQEVFKFLGNGILQKIEEMQRG